MYIAQRNSADTLENDIGVFILPQNVWDFWHRLDFSGPLVRSLPFPSSYNFGISGSTIPLLLV